MKTRLAVTATAIATIAGCTEHRAALPASNVNTSTSRTSSSSVYYSARGSAAQICRTAFSDTKLLGWDSADVAELRAYQFGGPVPHHPLQSAFSGVSAGTPGAWCLLRQAPE